MTMSAQSRRNKLRLRWRQVNLVTKVTKEKLLGVHHSLLLLPTIQSTLKQLFKRKRKCLVKCQS
jgi:hypothetical protein